MNNHYFEGIYLKQQNKKDTLSLIPAYHVDKRGRSSASLQVITNQQTCYVPFEAKDYRRDKKRELIYLGKNIFGRSGCQFDIKRKGISLKGYLHYDRLVAPSYDIMGPFRYVPFMECRHQVISLSHQVEGKVCWNQKEYVFSGSRGYIEGDRGSSFPSQYLWTQASVEADSIMLSLAKIPMGWMNFYGIISFIFWKGKEYRIATYCGARLCWMDENQLVIRQGKETLWIRWKKNQNQLLRAPILGSMTRNIHESVSCTVQYRYYINNKKVMEISTDMASLEYNWRN